MQVIVIKKDYFVCSNCGNIIFNAKQYRVEDGNVILYLCSQCYKQYLEKLNNKNNKKTT